LNKSSAVFQVQTSCCWQAEVEYGTNARRSIGPDSTTVPGDNPPDIGQSDAGSLELRFTVEALKYAEQLVGMI
jgi:hypothetical protein